MKEKISHDKILITSALPYVNNMPHLGNIIGAVLSADVFARFCRSQGKETLFICGSDEHGTTTEAKAREEGLTPKELCDKYHAIHKKIYEWFSISFDHYGRTSDPTQTQRTQEIFFDLQKNGYITEKEVEQLYDEQEKTFLADRYVEGECPHCHYASARGDQCDACGKLLDPQELLHPISTLSKTTPITKSVRHLFLDLGKLQSELEAWVSKRSVEGNWSANAIRTTNAWFKEGLQARAITRDLQWGVPVPLEGWEHKKFYVWFDAPIGYISITQQFLGENYKEWWNKPDKVKLYQFMGKDNIPFHTILFPGSLLGTKKPYTMLYHLSSTEYLNYEDGKFSKSRRIGVFCDDAMTTGLSSDVFRYYLLTNRPETSDTVFSWTDFGEKLNNELVANLGNLINRTTVFISRYSDSVIPASPQLQPEDERFWSLVQEKEKNITSLLQQVKLKEALKTIMELSKEGNVYYQQSEPWKTIKDDPKRAHASLFMLAHFARDIAILIEPFLPLTAQSIFTQLGSKKSTWEALGSLEMGGQTIGEPVLLFAKIESKTVQEFKENFSGQDDPFSKCDIRVGTILSVKKHPSADKLYVEELDLGTLGTRHIVSGLAPHYTADELIGKHVLVVANLRPVELRGVLSQGMLLAVENKKNEVGVLLSDAPNGTPVFVEAKVSQPAQEISIEEFRKVKLKAIEKGVTSPKGILVADGKAITVDKGLLGRVS